MISKLVIENFRSIEKADLPLGKITVLTGANNSGKSSLLYALLVLRDFVMNPNQSLENLFALPFINLGGFEEVVSKRGKLSEIKMGIEVNDADPDTEVKYQMYLTEGRTRMQIRSTKTFKFDAELSIGLPYTANLNRQFDVIKITDNKHYTFDWNGIIGQLNDANGSPTSSDRGRFEIIANKTAEVLSQTDFIPITRGFTKPYFSVVPMTGNINTEEEVATLLKSNGQVYRDVQRYLLELADRQLIIPQNGTPGLFRLMSKNEKTGLMSNIVNEGTGTNQLVTMLAKIFQPNNAFICVDEPEVHLHPSMVRKLADAFTEIANDYNKQFLVSTHSEHFIQALLTQVAEGNIAADDVKVYYLEQQNGVTHIEAQPINDKGQISGGLSHFYESELTDLKSFFHIP